VLTEDLKETNLELKQAKSRKSSPKLTLKAENHGGVHRRSTSENQAEPKRTSIIKGYDTVAMFSKNKTGQSITNIEEASKSKTKLATIEQLPEDNPFSSGYLKKTDGEEASMGKTQPIVREGNKKRQSRMEAQLERSLPTVNSPSNSHSNTNKPGVTFDQEMSSPKFREMMQENQIPKSPKAKELQSPKAINPYHRREPKDNNIPKKSVFKTILEEKTDHNPLYFMNENCLPALIFAEFDVMHDYKKMSEDVIYEKLILKNPNMALLCNLISSKQTFLKAFFNMTESNLTKLFEMLRMLYLEVVELIKGARRIRSIFETAPEITCRMSIEDAMKSVVDYICESLKCERATVFAVDKLNNELWSKVAKDTNQTIKIPMGKGVSGYVAQTGNALNIRDAYHDNRFDPSFDKKTGYRTRTILAVPIINNKGEVEGVVQAINKIQLDGRQQYFDRNDQGLLEMVSSLAGTNIHNTIQYNQQTAIMNNLRSILKVGLRFFNVKNDKDLIEIGESMLRDLFNSQNARVYIRNPDNEEEVYTYDEVGNKKNFGFIGILGDSMERKTVTSITSPGNDPRFNGRQQ
jgi:hypothetical protein